MSETADWPTKLALRLVQKMGPDHLPKILTVSLDQLWGVRSIPPKPLSYLLRAARLWISSA